ncbi:hypothetical protein GCM10010412_041120 [Nonomuraea recticatena]|uniref:Uncharacterized protein n=1 Tax=Nonomuraea recticatena TaxID=46178 RepID=A0ABP6EEP1_9ACTN
MGASGAKFVVGTLIYRVALIRARNVKKDDLLINDHLYKVSRFPKVWQAVTGRRPEASAADRWTRILDENGVELAAAHADVEFLVLRPYSVVPGN